MIRHRFPVSLRLLGLAGILIARVAALVPTAAAAQTTTEPIEPLPHSTGPHLVGTAVAYLTDSARRDSLLPQGRAINLQLWYPAAIASDRPTSYFMEPGIQEALNRFGYFGMDSSTFGTWSRLTTHSSLAAPPAAGLHPLLVFSVGLGMIRANYTSLAEELASYGYIVAIVESPLQGMLVRPNGLVVTDTIGVFESASTHRRGVEAWAGDMTYALDLLVDKDAPPPLTTIVLHIDPLRIGALGHSSGGLVAVQTCQADPRVAACVNMDGGLADPEGQFIAGFAAGRLAKPTLFVHSQPLYDDTTFARRGITREEWTKRGEAGQRAFEAFAAASSSWIWVASIAGTGHLSFSDVPFVMPTGISRFGGRIIDAERGWQAITAVLRAFFEQVLDDQPGALHLTAAQFPEVTLTEPPQ